MLLRDYQRAAVDATLEAFKTHRAALIVLPTGTGKTVVFAHIAAIMHGRVMVLAHRKELIEQAASKLHAVTGEFPAIEMADQYADEHGWFGRQRCVVSSVQTQIAGKGGGRMQRFKPREFSLVIIDEAHHAPASTYRRIIDYYGGNENLRILGVTATPDRADERALGQVFETVAYEYDIASAIDDGWLVDIRQRFVEIDSLDFSAVRTTAGDLNGRDLASVLEAERPLHEIVDPLRDLADGRKTLVFCASVAQADRTAEIINRHAPDSAQWIDGKTDKRRRAATLDAYRAGEFQFLVNVGVFTEGFDDPGVEVVAMARPTKSRALYTQMIGRGTRPLPGVVDEHETPAHRKEAIERSAKPFVEIIDFVGNAGRHKLISMADVLGGKYDDEVVAEAKRKMRDDGIPSDVADALEAAKAKKDEERRREREAAERRRIVARASYSVTNVNPFDLLGVTPVREHVGTENGPTEKQIAFLARSGIGNPEGMTRRRASQLITELIERRKQGKATYKQTRMLKQHGYDGEYTIAEASALIDQIIKGKRRANLR